MKLLTVTLSILKYCAIVSLFEQFIHTLAVASPFGSESCGCHSLIVKTIHQTPFISLTLPFHGLLSQQGP